MKAQRRTDKTDMLALKLEVDTLKHTLATNEEELVSIKIECSSYCNLLEVKNVYRLTDCWLLNIQLQIFYGKPFM